MIVAGEEALSPPKPEEPETDSSEDTRLRDGSIFFLNFRLRAHATKNRYSIGSTSIPGP